MDILTKIIQFFLCFTILVGIHELGHYIMARVFKIRVDKFYIFFDLGFSLFKFRRGHTEYGLGWLPLGGYCKIAGMIDESMDKEYQKQPPQPWEFRSKPAWQRFLVMIAGVVMNVVLAVAIYIGVCYTWGDSYFSNEDAKWGYNFNEAGHSLGFRDGDRLVSIDGEAVENPMVFLNSLLITEGDRRVVVERDGEQVELTLPLAELIAMRQNKGYEKLLVQRMPFLIDSVVAPTAAQLLKGDEIVAIESRRTADRYEKMDYRDYRSYLQLHAGDTVQLTVLRDGGTLELPVPVSAEGTIGVIVQNPYTLRTQTYTFWESIPAGFRRAGDMISSYWEQLKMIVQPKTKMYEELGGFIAIGSIFPSSWDWQDFWLKTAFLSIILAVMNILPIPGLDGGHAIFTFWEMVTGRKVSDKVLEGAQYVGLIIILFLLLYANGNDIYRFFIK
ncbi:RIP metalloprotease RseP [Alistipes senegalensis]|uniref:RIP metalloprotease RseP n=1 Tax=Alistipes senegalensis TaxID=1288121 RepID=UPI00242A547C|nr:RIP metalloprotease RseP [Alistipes senegalensis]MCI7308400.1 RIP metalloprotease RseP [Alistipes senegalensis]MDD7038870.1 RIP metalloprotease RseP [Alistipes senegalensis]MDY2877586.1 RIP metalloprotease RseP [Alistipes senegalensis]